MSLFSLSHVNCGGPQGRTDDGERLIAQIDTMEKYLKSGRKLLRGETVGTSLCYLFKWKWNR